MKKLKEIYNKIYMQLKHAYIFLLAVSLKRKPNLINVESIDISKFESIDDILDYVNHVGCDKFDNNSIKQLKSRMDQYQIDNDVFILLRKRLSKPLTLEDFGGGFID